MVETIHLFEKLDLLLIQLLSDLNPEEWELPTVAKLWTVKDVAAHLLDGNLRTLSIARDGYMGDPPHGVRSYEDSVTYLNRLNADWVQAFKRVSPVVLVSLLKDSGIKYTTYLNTLDLESKAIFSVAWAGEEVSKNWMHIAREYTEKWLHQQQIRDATQRPGIMTEEFFKPFINTFMLGLPHAFRNMTSDINTTVKITIPSSIGGAWALIREPKKWNLVSDWRAVADAEVIIEPDVAWKLFSKSIRYSDNIPGVAIKGDRELALVALSMVSVMA